jgi:hypothetical protein
MQDLTFNLIINDDNGERIIASLPIDLNINQEEFNKIIDRLIEIPN